VNVHTGGGQIDFAKCAARFTRKRRGGIRVVTVPADGSGIQRREHLPDARIGLAASGYVRGTITAWINPDAPSGGGNVRLSGSSQLTSATATSWCSAAQSCRYH